MASDNSADICMIFNPAAGKNRARERLEKLRQGCGQHLVLWPTEGPGQAQELARRAALDGFKVVAAAGGDGTVHEVANGLLRAGRPEVQFAVLPIGSANDYAHSLGLDRPPVAKLQAAPAVRTVDVGLVRDETGREEYFVCCLGLGFSGAVTLESRRIRRLQGVALYGLATLRALWRHFRSPLMEIAIDNGPCEKLPTLMFSVLLGKREGGFVLAPQAELDDGWFNYVHAGDLSRWEVLKFLPQLATSGPTAGQAKVRQGRCRHIRLTSPEPLTVHVDGEFFARPEDGRRQLDIQIHPGALQVRTDLGLN